MILGLIYSPHFSPPFSKEQFTLTTLRYQIYSDEQGEDSLPSSSIVTQKSEYMCVCVCRSGIQRESSGGSVGWEKQARKKGPEWAGFSRQTEQHDLSGQL